MGMNIVTSALVLLCQMGYMFFVHVKPYLCVLSYNEVCVPFSPFD